MAKADDNLAAKPAGDPLALAQRIEMISMALNQLLTSGLNEKAIVTLLHHDTKISQRDIRKILVGLRDLRKTYCRKDSV